MSMSKGFILFFVAGMWVGMLLSIRELIDINDNLETIQQSQCIEKWIHDFNEDNNK